MALDASTLRASWRAWCGPMWFRGAQGPEWLQWLWTILFNTAVAAGLTILT